MRDVIAMAKNIGRGGSRLDACAQAAEAEVDAIERAAKTLMTSEGKTVADDAEAVALLMRIAEEAP